MSKRKDKERAKREGSFRQPAEQPRYLCPFPNCSRPFTKEEGKLDACGYHRQLVIDIMFVMGNIRPTGRVIMPAQQADVDKAVADIMAKKGVR